MMIQAFCLQLSKPETTLLAEKSLGFALYPIFVTFRFLCLEQIKGNDHVLQNLDFDNHIFTPLRF